MNDHSNSNTDTWDERYRRYQSALAARYLIPALRRWGVGLDGRSMLEVGCGDGGCAAEFERQGCRVTAMDIDKRLVETAATLNQGDGSRFSVYSGDICDPKCPGLHEGPFELILMRDVIEHLERPGEALAVLRDNLAAGGVVLVVFPPYYSPYGAHQQILPRKKWGPFPYNKFPWLQFLPDALFNRLVDGTDLQSHEVRRLRGVRMTLGKFERTVKSGGFEVRRRRLYLSRPTFAIRYGLPVVNASIAGRIPWLREAVVTAGYYLLERR